MAIFLLAGSRCCCESRKSWQYAPFRMPFLTPNCVKALKAKRRYLSYSEGDFEVFCPAGATRSTDGSEIWHEVPLLPAKLQPHRCNDKGIWTPKLFTETKFRTINTPQGCIPCAIFMKFAGFNIISGCVSCKNLDGFAQGITELRTYEGLS